MEVQRVVLLEPLHVVVVTAQLPEVAGRAAKIPFFTVVRSTVVVHHAGPTPAVVFNKAGPAAIVLSIGPIVPAGPSTDVVDVGAELEIGGRGRFDHDGLGDAAPAQPELEVAPPDARVAERVHEDVGRSALPEQPHHLQNNEVACG